MRQFVENDAARSDVPIILSLTGPTGTGKTLSAIKIGVGIRDVLGWPLKVIDTEADRALHYAPTVPGRNEPGKYNFKHIPMPEPFSPDDYLNAIDFAVRGGPAVIIIDTLTHEHDGPGGVCDLQAAALAKQSGKKDSFRAWGTAKSGRKRLMSKILRTKAAFIFCFRAKEKLKPVKVMKPDYRGDMKEKTEIVNMGWLPIGGDCYVYESILHAILHPGCDGVPTWQPTGPGEDIMMKLPQDFRDFLNPQGKGCQPHVLDEEVGRVIARWAKGGPPDAPTQPQAPVVNPKVKWASQQSYGGKPITDVPEGDRLHYVAALVHLRDKVSGKQRDKIHGWIDALHPYLPEPPASIQVEAPTQNQQPDPVTYIARSCGVSVEDAAKALDRYGADLVTKIREGFELEANTLELVPPVGYGDK